MRTTFAQVLLNEAKKDRKLMLLTGDLGYSVFEDFQAKLPDQYLNCGVAEQNMAGVAAGMAMEGLKPVIYSIVPFTTMRNFEQIRNDICYQNLNVNIVGVGAGFSYGPYGHTHHALEDIGVLRTLPNLVILAPGDPTETRLAVRAMLAHRGPVYLRLGKAGEPVLHKTVPKFRIGKGIVLQEGTELTIIATSTMVETAMVVAKMIPGIPGHPSHDSGNRIRVVSMPTIKPLDEKIILDSAKKTGAIVTLEEHSIIGGLGSAVAEVIAESGLPVKFKRIAVPDRFTKTMGTQSHMRRANGLDTGSVIRTIRKLLH